MGTHDSRIEKRLHSLYDRLAAIGMMANPRTTLPSRTLRVLIGWELVSAICGFIGGIPLILDPSGKFMGLPLSNLNGLPIHDYLVPGLWLFFVYGVGLSAAAFWLWRRKPWARLLALAIGIIWIVWISFEVYLWGPSAFVAFWYLFPIVSLSLLSLRGTNLR